MRTTIEVLMATVVAAVSSVMRAHNVLSYKHHMSDDGSTVYVHATSYGRPMHYGFSLAHSLKGITLEYTCFTDTEPVRTRQFRVDTNDEVYNAINKVLEQDLFEDTSSEIQSIGSMLLDAFIEEMMKINCWVLFKSFTDNEPNTVLYYATQEEGTMSYEFSLNVDGLYFMLTYKHYNDNLDIIRSEMFASEDDQDIYNHIETVLRKDL